MGYLPFIVVVVLFFVMFYFLMIRPMRQREKQHDQMVLDLEKGDVVIITGKGAEQSKILGDKRIPWDDRAVVREELKRIK